MRILHLFTINSGGAAIAAKRIAESVNYVTSNAVSNDFLSLYENKKDVTVQCYFKFETQRIASRVSRKLHEIVFEPRCKSYPGPFSTGEFGVATFRGIKPYIDNCDILHIHWIGRGFLSLSLLKKIVETGKPIVWTMHDMWAFTGGCYYDGMCGKYLTECRDCSCTISGRNDFRKEQTKKRALFCSKNVYLVGCSNWITKEAKKSLVLNNQPNMICIPNPINHNAFIPIEDFKRDELRRRWNIPRDKITVLFGAMAADDYRKGGHFIRQIMEYLKDENYHFVVFGYCSNRDSFDLNRTTFLGPIAKQNDMNIIYSINDVFIAPSIQENLANTVLESLTSGTPVVAFNIGGMSDMIKDGYNGALIEPFDIDDFVIKIQKIVRNSEVKKKARDYAIEHFSYEQIGEKYYGIYRELLEQNSEKGL